MTEEISNLNQSETSGTRLDYEPPKLRKHGTIHDLTFAGPGGANGDSNTYANPAGS